MIINRKKYKLTLNTRVIICVFGDVGVGGGKFSWATFPIPNPSFPFLVNSASETAEENSSQY